MILSRFNELDDTSFRDVVRGFVVSMMGSEVFFEVIKMRIKEKLALFNTVELVYITKCFYDKEQGDKELYELIEKSIAEHLKTDVVLEELCAVADCLSQTNVFTREFQKLFENIISTRIKEIVANKKVSKFLYTTFNKSKMCSAGLMNLLYKAFTG